MAIYGFLIFMTKIAIASATKTQEKEPPKHEFLIEKQRFSDKKKDEKRPLSS